MTTNDKAAQIDAALKQLSHEIAGDKVAYSHEVAFPAIAAIYDFIKNAPDASKARLYDILKAA
jgi:hypothetical protein